LGADAAWLDQVSYTPGIWLESAGPPVNGHCSVIAHAVPGKLYELQASADLSSWSQAAIFAPASTAVTITDIKASTSSRYYRIHELPGSSIQFAPPMLLAGSIILNLLAPSNLVFQVESSTNLKNWSALGTVTNSSKSVSYTNKLDSASRFYRARVL